jgi:hypothetical protein
MYTHHEGKQKSAKDAAFVKILTTGHRQCDKLQTAHQGISHIPVMSQLPPTHSFWGSVFGVMFEHWPLLPPVSVALQPLQTPVQALLQQ